MSAIENRESVSFVVTEPAHTPMMGLLLGYLAMVPILLGAVGSALLPHPYDLVALDFAATWAAAVLTFLAGVRRGLSFRTAGGPTTTQIGTMFVLFCLGIVALFALMLLAFRTSLGLLLLGYLILAIGDPIAAKRGEAPLFFARLRPVQMLVPLLSILLMIGVIVA